MLEGLLGSRSRLLLHRVTASGVGGIAALRICDFSGLAGDCPGVCNLCRAAVSIPPAITPLNVSCGSRPPFQMRIPGKVTACSGAW
jgi:hypothetical protein